MTRPDRSMILDARAMSRALQRMAVEVLELARGTDDLVLIGVQRRGVELAERIARLIEAQEGARMDGDLTHQHIRNFLDCVKSRSKCNCDLETGHRSTSFAHLANIALAMQSRLEWDAKKERITNNEKANQLLDYAYRAPWER